MNYMLLSIVLALLYGVIHYSIYINFDKYKKPLENRFKKISELDSKLLMVSSGICMAILMYESLKYILKRNKITFITHPVMDVVGIMIPVLLLIYLF
uniref:Uncharacterized protein n=1 Tax=viral metagenome TaxID=1070528 RepID=A0A6C0JA26_9ZZZZ